MVLPPSRKFSSPYEISAPEGHSLLEKKVAGLAEENLHKLNLVFLGNYLGTSPRTLSRRFAEELQMISGRWIQGMRLEMARGLLEKTKLTNAEVCYKVGYQDVASFSRLFAKSSGMAPSEFRRHLRG